MNSIPKAHPASNEGKPNTTDADVNGCFEEESIRIGRIDKEDALLMYSLLCLYRRQI